MIAQKLADAGFDFRPRPAETHAACCYQAVRVRSRRPQRIIEVNADIRVIAGLATTPLASGVKTRR